MVANAEENIGGEMGISLPLRNDAVVLQGRISLERFVDCYYLHKFIIHNGHRYFYGFWKIEHFELASG